MVNVGRDEKFWYPRKIKQEKRAEVTSQFAVLLCNQLLEKSPNSIQGFIEASSSLNDARHLLFMNAFSKASINYLTIIFGIGCKLRR